MTAKVGASYFVKTPPETQIILRAKGSVTTCSVYEFIHA
jgi:hypothetical protein